GGNPLSASSPPSVGPIRRAAGSPDGGGRAATVATADAFRVPTTRGFGAMSVPSTVPNRDEARPDPDWIPCCPGGDRRIAPTARGAPLALPLPHRRTSRRGHRRLAGDAQPRLRPPLGELGRFPGNVLVQAEPAVFPSHAAPDRGRLDLSPGGPRLAHP